MSKKAITLCFPLSDKKRTFLDDFDLFCPHRKIYCDSNTFLGLFLVRRGITESPERYWFWRGMHGRADFNLFFSLRGCDALLIGHRSGRLLPNQDQGKLMSLRREKKSRVCFIVVGGVLHRHQGARHQTKVDFDSTPEGSRRRNEKMWWR